MRPGRRSGPTSCLASGSEFQTVYERGDNRSSQNKQRRENPISSVFENSRNRDRLHEGGDVRSAISTEAGKRAWDELIQQPKKAVVFIDLYGTLVGKASSDGTPQVDPRVRGRLHQMTGPFGAVAILTGWSVAQVSGLGLAVPGCHILGQLGAEHWGPGVGEESILTSLMPMPLGLSMAEATLRAAVEGHGMAAEAIHRKSHSLAYRFAEGSDPEAVGRVVFQLRKTTEDAGDLTLLEDRSVVKLLPKGLDKRKALRRFLSGFVPWKPSVIMNVGDAPDRVLMEELDRMRRDEGQPTLKVGIAESLPGEVDLAIPGPPEGPLMLMDAMCGSARTR